ncbi:MAG: DUF1549 domain-containing protein [Planctomicrobium sp.]|jgi:hypothetical protein|nr:DUF1549 domain-containing protein [Planctomicrobium sp.]
MNYLSFYFMIAFAIQSMMTGSLVFAEDDSVQERAKQFGRQTTNLQYNKDGSVGLIRLSKPTVNDEVLAKIGQFPDLRYLAVVAPKVTDTGIQHIEALNELDTLLVSEAIISSHVFDVMRSLTKLERLYLNQLEIDEIPAGAFSEMPNLVSLSLSETRVGNSALSEVGRIEKLQSLILDGTDVTDKGLVHLTNLNELQLLSLCDCKVTGNGFSSLSNLDSLKHLVLSGSELTDDGLREIEKLNSLETLEINNTQVSSESVTSLREKLPKTKVFHHSDVLVAKKKVQDDSVTILSPSLDASSVGPVEPSIKERIVDSTVPDFQRHVVPLLGRLGCNSRNCHGSFQGRGGFRLSMFGYDFQQDLENLSERIDLEAPDESLILNKPTSADEHEGGQRFAPGSWQQETLRRWIQSGAKGLSETPATFVRLKVEPNAIEFDKAGQTQQLHAVAVWSDGTQEDVTCFTRFETKDDAIADVDKDGLVTAKGSGGTHVVVYYDNGIQPIQVLMPLEGSPAIAGNEIPTPTRIDELVVAKLAKLKVMPSELSTDFEFLRRVSLDLIGTLPTPKEIKHFVADTAEDKRERKIDELLEHPAYVAWWTNRLCDLTGSNAGFLGGTEMASPVSLQWQAWIERRVRDNVSWDKIASDLITSTSRRPGQTFRDFAKEQSGFTRRLNPKDYSAPGNPMPHYWYRDNIRIPSDKALSFGYIFMGLRLDCAQCHKHPFDRWSQQDFELFTEFFTRIQTGLAPDAVHLHNEFRQSLGVPTKLDTAALRRQSYLRIAAEGRSIPWREVWVSPPGSKPQPAKLLGAGEIDLSKFDDPRQVLAQWLRTEPNRYLAKAFVNRIWSNYFGRGIINPTDDLNLANPASHPELIQYLIDEFVLHDYDMKWLHRTITSSRTYQLSWKPTKSNITDQRNYSHATVRRLPAEVLIDAIQQATVSDMKLETFGGNVALRKVSQHPRSYQTRSIDYSLLVFGKSLRMANCDCERNLSPTLPQALYVRNDSEILDLLDRPDGWISQIASLKDKSPNREELIATAYLRTFSRMPLADEVEVAGKHFDEAESTTDGLRDLMWALLNSQEFLTNH